MYVLYFVGIDVHTNRTRTHRKPKQVIAIHTEVSVDGYDPAMVFSIPSTITQCKARDKQRLFRFYFPLHGVPLIVRADRNLRSSTMFFMFSLASIEFGICRAARFESLTIDLCLDDLWEGER